MTFVAIGEVLAGKYRVDKVLGIGGMGMVVAATHLELDQKVALKFMLPEAMLSQATMDRFLREARNAVKLRSEHVCRVLDVGKLESGAPYIVMEMMEGQDFAHVIAAHGRMPIEAAVDHLMQAMEGLAEAHAQGIVHRDLKPGNLFVTLDNEGSPLVKVLDFGISKSVGGGTKTGEVMGSPAYMAPEQMASSKDVDARADIWALGVILYQAITGAMPFEGDTLPALCMSVIQATPPGPDQIRADLPAGLAAVVMRCLEKAPDKRFANVGELGEALAPFGSAEAARSASGITKVLRRTGVAPVAPVNSALVAPTIPPTIAPTVPPTVAPVGRTSTLQSSAAQLEVPLGRPTKRPLGMILGGAAVAIAAVVMFAVMRSGGNEAASPKVSQPAAAPPPVSPEPTKREAIESPKVEAAIAVEPKSDPEAKIDPVKPTKKVATKAVIAKPAEPKPVTKPVVVTKAPEPKPVEVPPETKVEPKPVEAAKPETKPASKWGKMQHDGKAQ